MKAFKQLFLCLAVLLGSLIAGCAVARPIPAPSHPLTATPASLTGVAKGLDVLVILSVLAAGGGFALILAAPSEIKIGKYIAFVGAGVGVTALVTRASLWFIPWLAVGLFAIALGVAAYELYTHRKLLEDLADPTAPKAL